MHQQTFVRREIWGLEGTTTFDAVTLAYAKAVQVMQSRPVNNPRSWTYQAGIHAAWTAPPAGATWNACQHQSWFFLPWHRMYLYFFERIVRQEVLAAGGPADWALPYWNYDRPFPGNTIPPAFRQPTLPDGTANPLFIASPGRNAALMAGGQVPAAATTSSAALANTDFSLASNAPTFGGGRVGPAHFGGALGLLETTPHNVMHPTIGGPTIGQCAGGMMTDPACAALDPIFWLHHANIDRLWNRWLALGGGRTNPSQAAWLNASFVFVDENGATVSMTGAEVVDSAIQLGYVYDDALQPVVLAMSAASNDRPLPQREPRPPELVSGTEEPIVLAGSTVSTTITMPAATRNAVLAAAPNEARRMYITIDDITADQDPGLGYAVYVSTPGGERQHVGNVSLFGIEAMNDPNRRHGGAPGFRHAFDITDAVNQLQRQGRFDPSQLTVTFEPLRILPPPGEQLPAEAQDTSQVPAVRIGRVGLFVG